jgi:D-threo-aldose 1-dehydrogenase
VDGPVVTRPGLGCAQLGNLYQEISDDRAAATVAAAWDAGIRYFDTAPHYGLGRSERRLGAALRERPRGEFTISTKVGRRLEPRDPDGEFDDQGFVVPATHRRVWDFSADGVRWSLADSLERLGLDRVDTVLLHDPEDHADQALGEAWPALVALRDAGVVRTIGAGSKDVAFLTRLVTEAGPDVVMLAGRYTLLEQPALDDLLPACVKAGTEVLNAGIFNSGLLAHDRPHDGLPYEYGPAPAPLVARARRIAEVCAGYGCTLPAAAVAFAGRHPAVGAVVVGADSPEQVRRNTALAADPPPAGLWATLAAEGLIDERSA